ncbi:hypothetical protein LSM04_000559 [Trypanosoma melophagium]|uniref:uncharacterized protein n=1 Tax=Trypanosoma melophagium TaxID=715481 RepID=UPI00351A88CE|nr:hypothetical protein LSM04_000559 [Trypanosoma melophagium]
MAIDDATPEVKINTTLGCPYVMQVFGYYIENNVLRLSTFLDLLGNGGIENEVRTVEDRFPESTVKLCARKMV